jgi:D-alanyl-D-alanine carboxypeptidase
MANEIPVARRVTKVVKKKMPPVVVFLRSLPNWVYGVAGFAFVLPVLVFTIGNAFPKPAPKVTDPAPSKPAPKEAKPDILLGHYAYKEAPPSDLITIGIAGDGYELKLRRAAAQSFERMQRDASLQNVNLMVISAYRSKAEQEELFFTISKQRNQTPAERAKVSAPPGYSEHHTGYALDIGDGDNPSTNLSESFAQTVAYEWLRNNAPSYGFELSFPKGNSQGVMYEPWHWRFVGDEDSLKTFYKGRSVN